MRHTSSPTGTAADPRVTPIARTADVHLQIRPGTDAAPANAILHEMIRHDWIDHAFI